MTIIQQGTRADVILNRVEQDWRTTSYIDGKVYDAGFHWGPNVTRSTLRALYDLGLVQCQKAGGGYRWRVTPVAEAAPMPTGSAAADDLAQLAKRIGEIASQLPPPPPAPSRVAAVTVVVGDECDLPTLSEANEYIAKRLVRRAAYETARAMLSVLDGWIEGARENNEALGRREDDAEMFHANDVRRMVNDACRVMGTSDAWHA